VSQRFGSGDPDPHPDPYQNVTDPEHWFPDPLPHAGLFASFNFHISLLKGLSHEIDFKNVDEN
jgi:hypothetical protein